MAEPKAEWTQERIDAAVVCAVQQAAHELGIIWNFDPSKPLTPEHGELIEEILMKRWCVPCKGNQIRKVQ